MLFFGPFLAVTHGVAHGATFDAQTFGTECHRAIECHETRHVRVLHLLARPGIALFFHAVTKFKPIAFTLAVKFATLGRDMNGVLALAQKVAHGGGIRR